MSKKWIFLMGLAGAPTLKAADAKESAPAAAPVPPAPSASAAPAGVSKINTNSRRRRDPFLSIGMNYRQNQDVADSRPAPVPTVVVGGQPRAPLASNQSSAKISLVQYKFTAQAMAHQSRDVSVGFGVGVPFRKLSSSDPTSAQGSEMGGYEAYLQTRLARDFVIRTGYAQRKSDKLQLHDTHNEYFANLVMESFTSLPGRMGVSAYIGPEAVIAKGKESAGVPISYGPQVGAIGGLAINMMFTRDAHFRLSADFLLRRIAAYSMANVPQGGAGLFTTTPAFEYLLIENFWIGAFMELPSARPIGRESVFGNTDLPGLYGKAFGVRLKAASL